MTDNLDGKVHHGTSDFYNDPYCDSCDEDGRNVEAYSFCPVCGTFLCQSCHNVHSRLPSSKSHRVLRGDHMPASQEAKPVKYPQCSKYTGLLNDRYCKNHREMVCEKCQKESHRSCEVQSITDTCKTFDSSVIGKLNDIISNAQRRGMVLTESLQSNEDNLEEYKVNMQSEVRGTYEKAKSIIDQLYKDMEDEIQRVCISQKRNLSEQREKVSEMTDKFNLLFTDTKKVSTNVIDAKTFISYQEVLASVNDTLRDFDEIVLDSDHVECTFTICEELQTFLSTCSVFGKVNVKSYKIDIESLGLKENSSISPKPTESEKGDAEQNKDCKSSTDSNEATSHQKETSKGQADTRQRELSKVKIDKQDKLNVNIKEDKQACHITGIAVKKNGDILVIDWNNDKVKLFSPDGNLLSFLELSSLKLAYWPCDICMFDEKTAVVTVTGTNRLHILVLSETNTISLQRNINMKDLVWGVTVYGENLAIVCGPVASAITVVKLNGDVLWNVENDHQHGQKLFGKINYISDFGPCSRRIVVTDAARETISLLNVDRGEVLKTCTSKGKAPKQIVGNRMGHSYVCYSNTREIVLWSEDLTESCCLVSKCRSEPMAMAYNSDKHELLVSYESSDIIDRFALG